MFIMLVTVNLQEPLDAGRDCEMKCGVETDKQQQQQQQKKKKLRINQRNGCLYRTHQMYIKESVPTCLSCVLYCTVSKQHFGEFPSSSLAKFVLKDNDNS